MTTDHPTAPASPLNEVTERSPRREGNAARVLECAVCKGKLGKELVTLYEAWAIVQDGSEFWCRGCLEDYYHSNNLGLVDSLILRWEWDEKANVAVYHLSDAEKIAALEAALAASTARAEGAEDALASLYEWHTHPELHADWVLGDELMGEIQALVGEPKPYTLAEIKDKFLPNHSRDELEALARPTRDTSEQWREFLKQIKRKVAKQAATRAPANGDE